MGESSSSQVSESSSSPISILEELFDNSTSSEVVLGEIRYPLSLRLVATITCLFLLIIGSLGNSLVPLVVLRTKDLRNSTNLFLINLSIADLFVLITCAPTVLVELHSRPEVWYMGVFLCEYSLRSRKVTRAHEKSHKTQIF